jgi:hypothetical protein
MPEICRVYGIVVTMYYQDYQPPDFHARNAGAEVVVSIDDLRVIAGGLPARAIGLVAEWATARRSDLRDEWRCARAGERLRPIEPLP